MAFLLQSTPALAENDKITISLDDARKITSDLEYCKQSKISNDKIILNIKEQNIKLYTLSEVYKEKLILVEKDKEIYKIRGNQFEYQYSNCSDDLLKCNNNKPSRLVWFGLGFAVASVLGLTTLIISN